MSKPLALTELVLRDAHQSLLATRMRIEDMLPIAEKLDKALDILGVCGFGRGFVISSYISMMILFPYFFIISFLLYN